MSSVPDWEQATGPVRPSDTIGPAAGDGSWQEAAVDAGWHQLVRRVAAEADPGWLPDWPADLVRRAQGSALGCRLISVRLGASAAPSLFCSLSPPPEPVLAQHGWLHLPQADLEEAVLDVGALAMAPAIHTVVRRDQVRRLRQALGQDRYLRVLQVAQVGEAVRPDCDAAASLDGCIHSETAIVALARAYGLLEIGTVLADEHPALQQRLRIAFPPGQALQVHKGWLPRSTVLGALAARCNPINAGGGEFRGSAENDD